MVGKKLKMGTQETALRLRAKMTRGKSYLSAAVLLILHVTFALINSCLLCVMKQ